MPITFEEHEAFQHAAFGTILVTGAVAGVWAITSRWLFPGLGGVGAAFVPVVVAGATGFFLARRAGRRRLATLVAALGLSAATALAALVWPVLAGAPQSEALFPALRQFAAGGLMGSVVALGLVPGHLRLRPRDPLASALAAANLAGEERAYASRAAAAHAQLAASVERSGDGKGEEVRRMAHALAGEVVALAARASSLRRELGGVDRTLLATRAQELGAAARGTRDAAAADDFARAARAAEELGAHVASLDAAADRVRARLALQVVTLETAAFAFVNHRASAVADDALALGPLCERLADASAALRAEAAALDELSAFAPNPAGRAVA